MYGDDADHPSILSSLQNLGSVAQEVGGEYDDAIKWYTQSL